MSSTSTPRLGPIAAFLALIVMAAACSSAPARTTTTARSIVTTTTPTVTPVPAQASHRPLECSIPGVDGSRPGPFVDVRLVSVDPVSGAPLWTAHLGSSFVREWALDETILYVSVKAGPLVALDPADCTVRWSREQGVGAVGFIADDETLYAADEFGIVAVAKPDGTTRWQYDIPKPVGANLLPDDVTEADGVILIPLAGSNQVIGVEASSGDERFRTPETSERIRGLAAADGRMILSIGDSLDSRLLLDGSLVWSTRLPSSPVGPPAVSGGVVAVITAEHVVAVDVADGSEMWTADLESPPKGRLAAAGGAFHLLDEQGRHLSFDPVSGRAENRGEYPACCVSADLDGDVIVVNRGGTTATFALDGTPLWTYPTGADGVARLTAVRTGTNAAVMLLWTVNGAV